MKRIFSPQYEESELEFDQRNHLGFWTRYRTYCIDNDEAVQQYHAAEKAFHQARQTLFKLADRRWWNFVFPFRVPENAGTGMTDAVAPYPNLELPEPDRHAIEKIMRMCEEVNETIDTNVIWGLQDAFREEIWDD